MRNQHFIVGAETVRMLELGHPWIIADSFTRKWPQGKVGDLVQLADQSGRFLAMALLDPGERVIARVLSRKQMSLDVSWIKGRLQKALSLRLEHLNLSGTTAYRVVNGEGDGLPGLTVDRYGDFLMLQLYSLAWQPHLEKLRRALEEVLSPAGIYLKPRPQDTRRLESAAESKDYGRLLAGTAAPARLVVQENGISFLVSLEEGLNTGLFLDQRENRRDFMERVKGKRVLNLFSYTGAFSVTAATAGASLVTSVDASPSYTDWARENFGINRLNPKRHQFIVGDCFRVLDDLVAQGKVYDVVIMDPPSFSTTGKSRFTTRGGTAELVTAALSLLPAGGVLITSSNHQKVDIADYLKELRRGALKGGSDLRVVSVAGQPGDFTFPVTFPEGRYLKYVTSVKC